jgi:hypothetical protein
VPLAQEMIQQVRGLARLHTDAHVRVGVQQVANRRADDSGVQRFGATERDLRGLRIAQLLHFAQRAVDAIEQLQAAAVQDLADHGGLHAARPACEQLRAEQLLERSHCFRYARLRKMEHLCRPAHPAAAADGYEGFQVAKPAGGASFVRCPSRAPDHDP